METGETIKVSAAIAVLEDLDPQSGEYRDALARLLERIDPRKPYGTALFNALARLTWSMAFEAVALRVNSESGKLEVYLRRRAEDDTAYPGEWHAPGSVFRPGENERNVADRLAKEFGTAIVAFTYIGEFVDWDAGEARGSFLSRNYLVALAGNPREDEQHRWYLVEQLPPNTCHHHRDFIIPLAVKAVINPLGVE